MQEMRIKKIEMETLLKTLMSHTQLPPKCSYLVKVLTGVSFEVDAFTDSAFKGNPAAVCLLEEEGEEKWLQAVAREFNISKTCYLTRITESETHPYSPNGTLTPRFRLRWFTPGAEVSSFSV
ncbi:hypothetical protein L1049_015275 [Liquidambar formosana]|uniref:Uncharacterized protein n=1 Tax=Liquidambar formosana TaxID=63359 RepID=A0AAP0WZM3_LIQFO